MREAHMRKRKWKGRAAEGCPTAEESEEENERPAKKHRTT
jgi:hypothetical protein